MGAVAKMATPEVAVGKVEYGLGVVATLAQATASESTLQLAASALAVHQTGGEGLAALGTFLDVLGARHGALSPSAGLFARVPTAAHGAVVVMVTTSYWRGVTLCNGSCKLLRLLRKVELDSTSCKVARNKKRCVASCRGTLLRRAIPRQLATQHRCVKIAQCNRALNSFHVTAVRAM